KGQLVQKIVEPGPKIMGQYQPLPPQNDAVQTLFINYQYNPEGTLAAIMLSPALTATPLDRNMTFTYDGPERAWPASAPNALGHTSRFAYHAGLGVVAVQDDPNGAHTTNQYDRFGRLKKQAPPNKNVMTVSYVPTVSLPTGIPGVTIGQCELRAFASGEVLET